MIAHGSVGLAARRTAVWPSAAHNTILIDGIGQCRWREDRDKWYSHVPLKNRFETVILYWASQWLGAVFVPLNWRLRPDELTYCVTDCGAGCHRCR